MVLATGGAYLQVIASRARVESAKAQLETAKAVYDQTPAAPSGRSRRANRSQPQPRPATNPAAAARDSRNDLARQKINLARLTGLPANDNYDITDNIDNITYAAPPALPVDEAVKQALETRADLKSAESQVRVAERSRTAAKADRLPTFGVTADLGEIGTRFNSTEHTYTVVASIKIPIWQGGRAAGDIAQADANLDQRRAEAEDLRGKIESDIRNAYLDLKAATSQLELARNNQELAKETLRLSKEKFDAGVTDSLEVTQAVGSRSLLRPGRHHRPLRPQLSQAKLSESLRRHRNQTGSLPNHPIAEEPI